MYCKRLCSLLLFNILTIHVLVRRKYCVFSAVKICILWKREFDDLTVLTWEDTENGQHTDLFVRPLFINCCFSFKWPRPVQENHGMYKEYETNTNFKRDFANKLFEVVAIDLSAAHPLWRLDGLSLTGHSFRFTVNTAYVNIIYRPNTNIV